MFFYYFPVCYTWNFDLSNVLGDGYNRRDGDKRTYFLRITGLDYDRLGNKIDVIYIKINTEYNENHDGHSLSSGFGGEFVFSEYRLPFLFTFSNTPVRYKYGGLEDDPETAVYYDRIKKKVVFVVENKTIEITHRGKFLVYNGVSIIIERNSTLNVHINNDGVMSVSRSNN
jgi:hypothetical protein